MHERGEDRTDKSGCDAKTPLPSSCFLTSASSISLPLLILPIPSRRLQLLDHRDADRVDNLVCILGMKVVVVSKDREQETLTANSRRITRKRVSVSDGSRLRENARGRGCIFHAV